MGICIQVIRLCPITQCPLEFHGLISLLLSITQTVPTGFSLHVHDECKPRIKDLPLAQRTGTHYWAKMPAPSKFKTSTKRSVWNQQSSDYGRRLVGLSEQIKSVDAMFEICLTWRAISIWLTVSGFCFSTGFQTDCRSRATLCQATRTHLSNFPGRWTSR